MLRQFAATSPPGLLALLALSLAPGMSHAACDVDYTVAAGDTYYGIAEQHYGSRREWMHVFNANQTASGRPALLPGAVIYIPCVPGLDITDVQPTVATVVPQVTQPAPVIESTPAPVDETPASTRPAVVRPQRNYPANAELKLLTGGDYAPFTDQGLPEEGMVTEIVHAALDLTPSKVTYSVTWEDDWSQHLFPLLDEKTFDMGFPWLRPNCEANPENERCKHFHFSEPLMLMPIMLFVREDNQFRFDTDADIVGRSLCRPKGYFTHDLDRADRKWISESKITFVEAETPKDCFYKVLVGEVDAATVNLFLGATVILEMGLRNKVVPLEKPVSEQGLHLVISKAHWRGTTMLYRVNAGIAALKAQGRYQEIVERHLASFQSRLQ